MAASIEVSGENVRLQSALRMELGSAHLLRALLVCTVAGIACAAWTSAAIYLGDVGWGQLTSVAIALIPVVLLVSLVVVALFLEGTGQPTRSAMVLSLGYILFANVGIVLNPLYFFANYGAFSIIYQRIAGGMVALPLFSLALLTSAAFAFRKDLRMSLRPFEVWILIYFVGLTLSSFCIGWARANFLPFVVSDLAKDLVVPAGWIVFRYALEFLTPWQVLRLLVGFAILPPIIDMAYHLRDLLLDFPYGRYGGYATLPLVFFVGLLMFHGITGRILPGIGTTAMLLSSLLSLSRMTWLQTAAIVGAGLWRTPRMRKGAVLTVAVAVVVVVALGSSMPLLSGLLEARFSELLSSDESEFTGVGGEVAIGGLSGARKLTEIYSVLAEFSGGGIGEWIFGFGGGAEFEHLAPSREVTEIHEFRDFRIHNIHNIIAAVVFRRGVLGLIALSLLLTSFWTEVQRIRRRRPLTSEGEIVVWTVKAYFLLSLLKSMSVDVLLWTLEWGVLFAIVGRLGAGVGRGSREPQEA